MLRRHCLIVGWVVLGLSAAAGWAETAPGPIGPAPLVLEAASQPQEWMGPPQPPPAGLDARAMNLTGEDPVRAALWRAWSEPRELPARVERLQRAGLAAGIHSLDAPARALLLEASLGGELERAERAAALAPELPAAHAALAAARFADWQFGGALAALVDAIEVAPNHLEARLWLEASAAGVLFSACFGAALGFLGLAACAAFPRFARDLRRLAELPTPSAGALALALALIPAALGEGLAGLALGLFAFALLNASAWHRLCTVAAAALLLAALFPLQTRRAESYTALALDPLVHAAWATEQGAPSASELMRVTRAADHDAFASRAFALRLARQGALDEAAERFEALQREDASAELLANLATVQLLRGDAEAAIQLYERAVKSSGSAVLRFNLAQAYGLVIRLDAQDLALAEAQSLDADVLVTLNRRYTGQDAALVAYLPTPAATLLDRLHDGDASAFLARRLRVQQAPGVLGKSPGDALVWLIIAALAGLGIGAGLRRLAGPEEDLYAGIARLLQTRGGDAVARMAQLDELRLEQSRIERATGVLGWLVPGAAGMVAGRPLLALFSVLLFAAGAALYAQRGGAVPDPLALGVLPSVLGAVLLVGLGVTYLAAHGLVLALRNKD